MTNLKTILLAGSLLLAGCDRNQVHTPVQATIVSVAKDQTKMGCMGTDWATYVNLSNGRSDRLCGIWGKPGDKLGGTWVSGSTDSISDGYRP